MAVTLSAKWRRRAAWSLIRVLVKEAKSANAIYRYLREIGMGYRRQEVLQDIRLAKLGLNREAGLRTVSEDEPISVERYGTMKLDIGRRVMYKVMVALRHPETRELTARWINIKSNDYMTLPMIKETAREEFSLWVESASEGLLRGEPLWQWHIEAIELSQVIGDVHFDYGPMEMIWE